MFESTSSSATLVAPGDWRAIDFISDLHLSEATPRTYAAWAQYLRHSDADAVLILGDLFEAWPGDDARAEGFEAECTRVLQESAARRPIGFMAGNRDFLVGDAMLEACGLSRLPDPCTVEAFGQRTLLAHGDAMCIGDTEYQQFRALVRNGEWQRQFLALPLSQRWQAARALRRESARRHTDTVAWHDIDTAMALEAMQQGNARTLVHGHTHRPGDDELSPGTVRHVLSDWDLETEPHRAEVLRWSVRGFDRLTPQAAAGHGP